MECFNPIRIFTPSKYLSPAFADKVIEYVRCGKCAACQETLQKEWYYRAYYEYLDTVRNGGYMLMDCLTYSPKYVPRVSRYIRIPKHLNFMCFDYTDLRYFLVRLRRYLSKRGYDVEKTLRYFCAAEYGTDENATHRPHMHILFYVTTPNLDNYTLSKAIAECWKYGRTDGLPYKSRVYVDNYTIRDGLAASQRACKYVSKYVMKSSQFQKVIDKRLTSIMYYIYENRFTTFKQGNWKFEIDYCYRQPVEVFDYQSFESFTKSETGKKLYRDLKAKLNQFHRQSLGFGAAALGDIDINELMRTNIISIPDSKSIVMRIGLPQYYKRKIFYNLVKIDGVKYWVLNDDGLKYKEFRKKDLVARLTNEYQLSERNYHYPIQKIDELVDYVVNKRGRLKNAPFGESTIIDRLNSPYVYYNYSTSSDKLHFHSAFVTNQYLGNKEVGYIDRAVEKKDLNTFLSQFVYYDTDIERLLDSLKEKKRPVNDSKQVLFENLERVRQIYKQFLKSS